VDEGFPAVFPSFETSSVADHIVRARAAGLGFALSLFAFCGVVQAAPLRVVAAETVYGDLAQQLGGDAVSVVSILNNPAQDPHLFEADASTARAVAGAGLVIYNGAGYDPWMAKLLSATGGGDRTIVLVADVVHVAQGANPHLWYDPVMMSALAKAVVGDLSARDPGNAQVYAGHLGDFDWSMTALTDRIAALKAKYAGTPVTATEPVFDYMARAIGLEVRNPVFQLAVMNDTEPSARDVAAFEDDLRQHKVKVLLYNIQATGTVTQRMQHIAEGAHIQVVGVSEVEPQGMRYQEWMSAQLDALDKALSGTTP
jgi:zinc/manganese transport system substrate-binding protein